MRKDRKRQEERRRQAETKGELFSISDAEVNVPAGETFSQHLQKSPKVSKRSHSEISVPDGAEGGASEAVQAVDQDERARQVLPPFGDGVPHPVQAHVKLLDHIPVAVANVGGPGQEEVVGWFPHALRTEVRREELR